MARRSGYKGLVFGNYLLDSEVLSGLLMTQQKRDLTLFCHLNQHLYSAFSLENLNLSKYIIGYKKESYIYDLYGICNHSGNAYGGHYTSFIKNANGKWYHFNDTSVTEIANLQELITPKAYCLFYRKKTTE